MLAGQDCQVVARVAQLLLCARQFCEVLVVLLF